MKILICDDEIQYLHILEIHVQEYMKNHFLQAEIVSTQDPLEIISGNDIYDIAFLDIQMDEINGIALAQELRKRNAKIVLFFVTNYNQYIDNAMDLNAFRYFEKPFDVVRLYSGLDKAMEYLDGAYVNVYIKDGCGYQRLLVDDIMYVENKDRKTKICTDTAIFLAQDSFDEFCERLAPLFFYLVHKSFCVNLHYITKYAYSELYLTNGERIPIAPRKRSNFHRFWFEYLGRR